MATFGEDQVKEAVCSLVSRWNACVDPAPSWALDTVLGWSSRVTVGPVSSQRGENWFLGGLKKNFFLTLFPKKKKNNNNFVCLFIYFWLCWVFVATKAFSSCGEWGLLLLWGADSAAVAHRLSCSAARGVFLDQGWSPHLLHQQAASLPLSHQKSAHFPDLTLHI